MTGNPNDADDLLQDTYLKAYRFWDKYEKGTNIRAWLFRIMKNSYINRYRKETREPGMVDYDDVENFYDSIRDDSTDSNDLQKRMYSNMLNPVLRRRVTCQKIACVNSSPSALRVGLSACSVSGG